MTKSRCGFTLVELLVVVVIIAMLMALLIPIIASARASARQAQCASNQHEIFVAWTRANSRDASRTVRANQWPLRLAAYVPGAEKVFYCPDDTTGVLASSFGLNDHAQWFAAQDSDRIVMLDYQQLDVQVVGRTISELFASWGTPATNLYAARHFLRENVTHFDGRTESIEPQRIDPRYCALFSRHWRPARESQVNLPACLPTPP